MSKSALLQLRDVRDAYRLIGDLMEGDSEKQVAMRLGLSHATTHQYVAMLYKKLGVRSRSQLMAHVFKRLGYGRWTGFVQSYSGQSGAGPDDR